jgi:hypothetical protein
MTPRRTRELTGGEVVSAYRQICENARRTFRENEKLARKLGLQKTPIPHQRVVVCDKCHDCKKERDNPTRIDGNLVCRVCGGNL